MSQLLTEVMSNYFKSDDLTMPIVSTIARNLPLTPSKIEWNTFSDPARFERTFSFDSRRRLRDFLDAILTMEDRMNHHGSIIVKGNRCKIAVKTDGINSLTELDSEYSKSASIIYKDVLHYAY